MVVLTSIRFILVNYYPNLIISVQEIRKRVCEARSLEDCLVGEEDKWKVAICQRIAKSFVACTRARFRLVALRLTRMTFGAAREGRRSSEVHSKFTISYLRDFLF